MPPLAPPYADLTQRFYSFADPVVLQGARVVRIDRELAARLGVAAENLGSPEGLAWLGGGLPGAPTPIAMAYAGHQYGRFSRSLGDGRSVIVGHLGGFDIALKGGGPTPFTHRGDGYLTLDSALREFEIAQQLVARGIVTSRVLAVLETGRTIQRERPVPAGVLVRVAASHIRLGSFEYAAGRRDRDALARLVDWTLRRHWPELRGAKALLEAVVSRQAQAVGSWMRAGFVHGMLNTDNILASGEAMDFATAHFTDERPSPADFGPADTGNRYAFAHQPAVMRWNLARFAEALLPLLAEDRAQAVEIAEAALAAFDRETLDEAA
jgi:uncharacterized protein YdiU (UPF0061 family)